MLVLKFRVAGLPFALPVGAVVEVVPRVEVRALPHAPPHVVGLLRYRGAAVPVVDLGLLMGGPACRERLDTRIILVDLGKGSGYLAMVAERVDEVFNVDESRRSAVGLGVVDAPYLGEVFETDDGLLQVVVPGKIPGTSAMAAVDPPEAP